MISAQSVAHCACSCSCFQLDRLCIFLFICVLCSCHAVDKSASGLHSLMNHLEAAESRANKAAGIDRVTKKVPFASLGAKGRGVKRPRSNYSGPLLDVDSDHAITDLPVAKREQCYTKLLPAVKLNLSFDAGAGAGGAVPPASAHSPASVCAALEYGAWRAHHTSSSYLGAVRTLLQNVAGSNAKKQPFAGVAAIDWAALPSKSNAESDSDSGSSDDSSGSDSEDEDSGARQKRAKVAPRPPSSSSGSGGGGGFISASSLAGFKPASSASKTGSGAFAGAGSFRSAGSVGSAASKSAPAAAAPSKPLSSFFTPASRLATSTSAAPAPAPAVARTPPKSSSSGAPKLKFGTALSLSFVHPVGTARAAAPHPPHSPARSTGSSRIAPLTLTPVSSRSGSSSSGSGSASKRPRLDLTLSPDKPAPKTAPPQPPSRA